MEVTMSKELFRRELSGFKPYVQGKPIGAVQREFGLDRIEKLASNENHFGASPKAVEAIREDLDNLLYYPESYPHNLMSELAEYLGVPKEQITIGSGGEGLLWQIALSFINDGDEIVTANPTFDVYRIATSLLGAVTVTVPLRGQGYDIDGMLAAVTDKTKLFFLCTPNNPTGHIATSKEIDRLVRALPEGVVLVLDEAYYDLAAVRADFPRDNIRIISERPNTIVLRTLSKTYGLAGVRFGYTISSPEIAQRLAMVGPLFKVNRLAIAGASGALKDTEYRDFYVRENAKAIDDLSAYVLAKGWSHFPTYTNFMWIDSGLDSEVLFNELQKRGVIIRAGYLWGEQWRTYFRISTGRPEQMQFFKDKLDEILAEW